MMTPEAQRIAIAAACGLRVIKCPFSPASVSPDEQTVFTKDAARQWRLTYPNGSSIQWLPNYLNDLNAMHEAEKHLGSINALSDYADNLDKVCVETHICPLTHWQAVVMATAAQRAEAFLRTTGKWTE
jgi:hypothetical protein